MRSMWKGAISFGLVTIPVKLFTATESKEIKFNYLHDECKTPIRYQKFCPTCERELNSEEIVRGYEYEKGRYVILKDEDFEKLPLDSIKSIQILDFVNLQEIDPIYFMKAYFLAPGDFGTKAYKLLYQALEETGKIAIAKVFLRTKENLATLRVYQNCLLLETMFYPDEVRNPAVIPELQGLEVAIHENELKMAKSLIDNLTAKFDPAKYTSDYRKALTELIEAKINDNQIEEVQRTETAAKIVDLMEALKASVKATEAARKPKSPKRKGKKATV
ncbi:Ku protein [Zhaonella formicivorans]|uniref:non-homologous end joining protein Ku n=1 Tax=Zhaonella formicivorans TaxID=2528593 RepID=UPI0010DEDF87|nr:Ku protein [Zhaonella formicivorans]